MHKAFILSARISFLGVEQVAPRPIFDAVFGIEPTQTSRDARLMIASVSGEDDRYRWSFTVSSQPDRIDIVQQALLDPGADTASFTHLNSVSEVLTAFVDRVLARSESLPWNATRIAFGCVAKWQVGDGAASNRALTDRFPGLPVGPEDLDVIFRRNKPRDLAMQGTMMRCNRIETWQATRSFTLVIGIAPRAVSDRHVVMLETDCNSIQDRQDPLNSELGTCLLRTLLSESIQLVPDEIAP